MSDSSSSTGTLLILGSSSSLTEPVGSLARAEGWQIELTSRKVLDNQSTLGFKEHMLDLSNTSSIELFLQAHSDSNYAGIISFLGETSELTKDSPQKDRDSYYITHCSNYFYLLEQLAFGRNILQKSGHLLVLGSRASEYGSFDANYAAVKGALIGFCRSIARRRNSPRITCILPGLILGSNMSNAMSKEVVDSHKFRSQDRLLDTETASLAIWQLFQNPPEEEKIRVIQIGPSYF